ncbi:MAG: hypothetical protein Q7S23_06030 [bacterium]|nr:hypothetical protein [bacterium]
MAQRRSHLSSGGSKKCKRQRRLARAEARKIFRAEFQERTDLSALTFINSDDRHHAVRRLKRRCPAEDCWDYDTERRLIVGKAQLKLFSGLRYRKERVITQCRLLARLERELKRSPHVASHRLASPAIEGIWRQMLATRYFLTRVSRALRCTFLHALLYVKEHRIQDPCGSHAG